MLGRCNDCAVSDDAKVLLTSDCLPTTGRSCTGLFEVVRSCGTILRYNVPSNICLEQQMLIQAKLLRMDTSELDWSSTTQTDEDTEGMR